MEKVKSEKLKMKNYLINNFQLVTPRGLATGFFISKETDNEEQ